MIGLNKLQIAVIQRVHSHHLDIEIFAEHVVKDYEHSLNGAVSVTWLNHWSVQVALSSTEYTRALNAIRYVGVDGIGLVALLRGGGLRRTSADSVVPRILAMMKAPRLAIIGGTPVANQAASLAMRKLLPIDGEVVANIDGYNRDLSDEAALRAWVKGARPNIVLVGLGAGRQDLVAAKVSSMLVSGIILTCGGFLDQIAHPEYYPRWAYPLRLNWLVRLLREPRRLWRRYTISVIRAIRRREDIREAVASFAGFQRYVSAFDE